MKAAEYKQALAAAAQGAGKKSAAKRRDLEQQLQRSVLDLMRNLYPNVRVWHTPNGGARSHIEAAILVGLGVRKGVADLQILCNGGVSAWMELKTDDGELDAEQRRFRDDAIALGCPYAVVRNLDEAERFLRNLSDARLLPTTSRTYTHLPTPTPPHLLGALE